MKQALEQDESGATLVEFAILLPVLLGLLMGLMDLCYQAYVQAVLEGAVQKAARDATIEAANTTTIDDRVIAAVRQVAGKATVTPSRLFYASFSVIKPEDFIDGNGNGRYDPGECFTDINGNGQWDMDPGRAGQGGASDVTVYKVRASYTRIFPVARLIGLSNNVVLTAATRFKNQPYATQSIPAPQQISCQ
ncbi:TadE/TadG family type IV pilus assembly protein [Sphingomonas pituitosa]|uniref:TadE/TadG family type IV pilus assembly protein n=1 Tax=Sphingomonas pituitosa TaxID=99597 RepID=UPI00082ED45B|nr:TadE/TadG family type IV pilus assembly protein [Sphingomonas pituitosa]